MSRWKDVKGFEGLYRVSAEGNVLSLRRNRLLSTRRVNAAGYCIVILCNAGKHKTIAIHRLVATAFLGESPLPVNHRNGVKRDNRIENLEFLTAKENTAHAIRLGLWNPREDHLGEKNPQAKLNRVYVKKIREMAAEGMSDEVLARVYGVSSAAIRHVVAGSRWSHVA